MRLTSLCLLLSAGLACGPEKNDSETAGESGSGASGSLTTTGKTSTQPTTSESSGDPVTGTASASGSETGSEAGETTGGSTGATTGASTGASEACESLAQEPCEQDPSCMAIFGQALEFPGCTPGPSFLACMPAMACDSVLLTICQDAPGEQRYELANGCIAPGFSACDEVLPLCGAGACEQLGEQGCVASPSCTPIHGAPHMEKDGQICVDFGAQVFLACETGDIACPPSITTVCPEGQPDMVFDSPSGCIPPGFVSCGAPAPDCQ